MKLLLLRILPALGISTKTVSRALRDSYELSPESNQLLLDFESKRPIKGFAKRILTPELGNHK